MLTYYFTMKGKTKCPYCGKYVIIEVPDGATGLQTITCPNCGMKIKVNVEEHETPNLPSPIENESPIHPTIRKIKPSSKPMLAGVLLLTVFLLGIVMGGIVLTHENVLSHGSGDYAGKIIDNNGHALKGVIVTIEKENISVTSDDNGEFFFENVSAGKHTIDLKKEGYVNIRAGIFVLPIKSPIKPKFVMKKGEGTENEKGLILRAIDALPVISTTIIIISFLPLIGAIFCFMKKYFFIAIISSIAGIFSIGFFIGSILSIIALVILLLSREEFGDEVKY